MTIIKSEARKHCAKSAQGCKRINCQSFGTGMEIVCCSNGGHRVLHHALMSLAGPELERTLVFDTYGTLAAVRCCQQHARCFPFFAKIDIKGYFPSIDHGVLKTLLARRFKNKMLLRVFSQIIVGHAVQPGKGLPIGALTSQHFANFYLSGLDRIAGSSPRVRGTLVLPWLGEARPRFIPARAGDTRCKSIETCLVAVHPRACGGHRKRFIIRNHISGSSPRVRGTLPLDVAKQGAERNVGHHQRPASE
jgi:hypothetical protein